MGIQVMTWAGLLTLVGLFASACAHHTSPSAQNLNEPPPSQSFRECCTDKGGSDCCARKSGARRSNAKSTPLALVMNG